MGGIVALGALLRFYRLNFPHRLVFDETYYAKDACLYLGHSASFCGAPQATEQSYVHPELGKWLIAAGIRIWGYNSYGWRFMPAVFGVALIAVAFFLGRLLMGRFGAGAGALLVAVDFVLITQSRLAMLDIFLAFFVVAGFLLVALEWRRVGSTRDAPAGAPGWAALRWRLGAGLAFGAACAVKWSGAYALAGAGVLLLVWNVGAGRRRSGLRGASTEAVVTLATVGGPVVAVYLASYGVWFADHGWSVPAFLHLQHRMLDYQLHLTTPNPYQTRAWTWPFIIRPIAYRHAPGASGAHQVLLFPDPFVWWACLPAGVWALYKAIRRRWAPERIVMTGWLGQYLPWLAVSRPLFFFYMTPVTPFMDLALAGGLEDFGRRGTMARKLTVAYLVATVVLLAYYYPGLVGALHPRLF